MKKLNYWFTLWQLRNYPASMLVPNWIQNLSWIWSKKERALQAGVARTHKAIGDILIKTTGDIVWGDETDSADDYNGLIQKLESRKLFPA